MSTNTENLNLIIDEQSDFYNVEKNNENFRKIDEFAGRKDNPHGVTAHQTGTLKIYYSFEALNDELGTDFNSDTPIETIIDAMPDNTGLKADVNTHDVGGSGTAIYPVVYGVLNIYKVRSNRVAVEYVSNVATGGIGYNQRWVGQSNGGVFSGFKKVFTEDAPPTPAQVGAISKNGDTMTGTLKNENKSSYSAVDKLRTVNGVDYMARLGLGSISNEPAASVELTDPTGVTSYGRFDVFKDKITYEPFDNSKKQLFGEHNKPTGTYTGNGSTREISIGGIGSALLVYSNTGSYSAIVTPFGMYMPNSGTIFHDTYKYVDGKLIISGSPVFLNGSGQTYSWLVL